jgi:threonine dehydratase
MQHAGSFNVRGVFTNLLTREVPATGVVAASGGNHGVAVAFAANRLDRKAAIFVPTIASPSKIELIDAMAQSFMSAGTVMRMRGRRANIMLWSMARCRSMPSIRPRPC